MHYKKFIEYAENFCKAEILGTNLLLDQKTKSNLTLS